VDPWPIFMCGIRSMVKPQPVVSHENGGIPLSILFLNEAGVGGASRFDPTLGFGFDLTLRPYLTLVTSSNTSRQGRAQST